MSQFLQRIWKKIYNNKSNLELFIESRRPQHPADVDHLMQVWTRRQQGSWL